MHPLSYSKNQVCSQLNWKQFQQSNQEQVQSHVHCHKMQWAWEIERRGEGRGPKFPPGSYKKGSAWGGLCTPELLSTSIQVMRKPNTGREASKAAIMFLKGFVSRQLWFEKVLHQTPLRYWRLCLKPRIPFWFWNPEANSNMRMILFKGWIVQFHLQKHLWIANENSSS